MEEQKELEELEGVVEGVARAREILEEGLDKVESLDKILSKKQIKNYKGHKTDAEPEIEVWRPKKNLLLFESIVSMKGNINLGIE